MARDPDDIDALLADVERSLSPSSGRPPARKAEPRRSSTEAPSHGLMNRLSSAITTALVTAAVIAAFVAVIAFFTPMFGTFSGALGAFLGALVAGVVARLRR